MSQINAPTPSIGRPSTTNAGSHNCQECDRNDSFDNMVQCDFCPSWWHFKCAGVDATVENRTWKCKNCVAKGSSQRPLSQTGSALQRLRERQELERQRADLELRQKHLIEQETFINSEESRSNRSGISPVGIDQRTQQWVDSIDEQAFIPEPTMLFMPPGNQMSSGIPQLRRQLAHCEAGNSTTEQLENLQRQLQLCHEFLATLSAGELPKSTGSNKSMAAQEKSNEGLGNRTGAIPKSVATGASIIGHPMTNSKPAGEYVQQQGSVMPTDSAESEALTPNHFLLGSSNGTKQPEVPIGQHRNLKTSWDLIQKELNIFWGRWIKEYLPVIRRQTKWFESSKAIVAGDLVMVVDAKTRNGWTRGRVAETIHGPDGIIRHAFIDTNNGRLRRAVHYLAPLDVEDSRAVSESVEMHPGEDVGVPGNTAGLDIDG
ncbi:uncharacterized protein LOC129737603 [Uranotaenia lowii]|uniref:uncharacterized protein LOC129737603 n=1 Tax=Uranotaenia lowii TaxID=190385 RepID=UPI002478381B|nr:uncharacterized protein LOC129737603 [Uranotaenia lowii]